MPANVIKLRGWWGHQPRHQPSAGVPTSTSKIVDESAARSRRNIDAKAFPTINPGETDTGQVLKACAV